MRSAIENNVSKLDLKIIKTAFKTIGNILGTKRDWNNDKTIIDIG